MTVSEQAGIYRDVLERLTCRDNFGPDGISSIRHQAMDHFESLGWPTQRVEAWRFTSTKSISGTTYALPESLCFDSTEVAKLLPAGRLRLVFVNGVYQDELSCLQGLPAGVQLRTVGEMLSSGRFQDCFKTSAVGSALNSLNKALFTDGLFLDLGPDMVLDEAIQLVHVHVGTQEPIMIHPRNLIFAGSNSRFSLAESHFSLGHGRIFTNSVSEIHVGAGARVAHYLSCLQASGAVHISEINVHQDRDSCFHANSLLLGGDLVRNQVKVELDAPGSEVEVNGLFVGAHNQHLDNDITINHSQPNCRSRQFFKGILDGRAHGVFTGRIVVQPDAQKTDSAQSNRNLLLSDDARIDARPVLEIYADDVKCAHGATTGQIDEEAFFYLQARGIDPTTAMDLLTYAFAHEVIEKMPLETIHRQAEAFLFQRFSRAQMLEEAGS